MCKIMSSFLEPLEQLFDFSFNCDECSSRLVENQDGFLVCSKCGLDHGPTFGSPRSAKTTFHIEKYRWIPTDYLGSVFKPTTKRGKTLWYYHLYSTGLNAYIKKSIVQVFVICDYFNLPNVVSHRAAKIYDNISDGKNHKALALVAASVLKATREYKYPLLYAEVLDYYEERGNRVFIGDIRKVFQDHKLKVPLLKPIHYVFKVISEVQQVFTALEVPFELIHKFLIMAKYYPTRNPHMFAVACVALTYSISYNVTWSGVIRLFPYHYRTVSTLMKELQLRL